ncbi:MAG: hypothetical protein LBB98_03820 [Treponema sp.]|nr:hypothetical protein [Treponema sp.]
MSGVSGGLELSKSANATLTISVQEAFATYRWVLDGATVLGTPAGSVSLNARELGLSTKQHQLTVFVTKGGVPGVYAKTLYFTVTD